MKVIISLLLTLVTLVVLFLTTDPAHLASPFLIVPFFLIFSLLAFALLALLRLTDIYAPKRRAIVLVGATIPTLLLVLQSIGQLTIRDVLTLGAIIALSYVYISRLMTASS
jgi:hypothetical protein